MCFQMPVRHGSAQNLLGLSEVVADPSLATAVGLLLHGYQQQYEGGYNLRPAGDRAEGVWTRMRKWFNVNF